MFVRDFFPSGFYEEQYFPELGGQGGGRGGKSVGGVALAYAMRALSEQQQRSRRRIVENVTQSRLLMRQLEYKAEQDFYKAMAASAAQTVVLLDL